MKTNVFCKRIGAMLLTLLLGISCLAITASARDSIDPTRESSLGVYFGADKTGFPAVSFSIYRVADISEAGEYSLTDAFAGYAVSFAELDSSGWRALAQTLDAYAARDGLSPLLTQETGQDGWVRFTGLTPGLYLVSGSQYMADSTLYTPEPMLVSLPGLGKNGSWSYDTEASCKFDCRETPGKPVSRKVQKVWKDQGSQNQRPAEISVQLLENGTVVDTVTLNSRNNWEYSWDDLDGTSKWQVVEAQVPQGYTTSVSQEGTVFILTNSRPTETPPKLPQTGLLWWPVPLLACGGLALAATGLILRHRRDNSDER